MFWPELLPMLLFGQIAAIAKVLGFAVATRNIKDFEDIPGLDVAPMPG